MGKFIRRLAISLVLIFTAAFIGLAVLLFFSQEKLIYHPLPYPQRIEELLPNGWQSLHFTTSHGRQMMFYKRSIQAPRRVWLFFGGNGSLAWDWISLLKRFPAEDAALLVEYPGYGLCDGRPSPATILENTEAAADALAQKLGLPRPELDAKLNVTGHSLGCAAALQFAARHPVQHVILFAPFTSMVAMAQRTVGWPLCELCRHRFDNEARLRELASHQPPPRVIIFHGTDDLIIPVTMSRQLAAEFPRMIEFHELHGEDHNSVLVDQLDALDRLLQTPQAF